MKTFKTNTGNHHMIDNGGNHFINGKCVNPLKDEGNIGDTYPKEKDRVYTPEVTGYVKLKVVEQPKGSGHKITVPIY